MHFLASQVMRIQHIPVVVDPELVGSSCTEEHQLSVGGMGEDSRLVLFVVDDGGFRVVVGTELSPQSSISESYRRGFDNAQCAGVEQFHSAVTQATELDSKPLTFLVEQTGNITVGRDLCHLVQKVVDR